MAEWPSTLPLNPKYGWTEKPMSSLVRTETDSGPAKLRRRFSSAPSQFSLQFDLVTDLLGTALEKATVLMQFYENSSGDSPAGTNGGVLTFGTLSHPRTGTAPEPITDTSGWRFMSPPLITHTSLNLIKASVSLELLG